MQTNNLLTIYVNQTNRLVWVMAFLIGLVAGTVFTGLSVGLPIGLACCTSNLKILIYQQIIFNYLITENGKRSFKSILKENLKNLSFKSIQALALLYCLYMFFSKGK